MSGQTFLAVVAGLALGVLTSANGAARSWVPLGLMDAVITAWTASFRLVVVPLVIAQLFLAVGTRHGANGNLRGLGLMVPIVFGGLLVLGALLTLGITSTLMGTSVLASLTLREAPVPAASLGNAIAASPWQTLVDTLWPPALLGIAEYLLPLMLLTCVFALAARRSQDLGTLVSLAGGVRDTTFRVVDWLVAPTPLILLLLMWRATITSGLEIGGVLLGFVVVECVALIALTLMLYPVAAGLGGASLSRFARVVFPAQVTAAATRSSLATVPALLQASVSELGMRAAVSAYVIPLAGATLKLSRAVSHPTKLVFLAHVLGLEVTTHQVVVFTVTVLLLSPTTVGVPHVISSSRSLPAYVAAGIPPEFVLLLSTTTWAADVFMTVLNTTGYLTAGVVINRLVGRHERDPQEDPEVPVTVSDLGEGPPAGQPAYLAESDRPS